MSLLADASFYQAEHLSLRQRLCSWSGFLYYISTVVNAFLAAAPALVMLYMTPQWIDPINSVWLVGAVLLVVLYHAGVPFLGGGYIGVDVFFVISGFLITGHLLREVEGTGRVRLGRFSLNRVRRLLSTAVVVLIVTLLVARLWGSVLRVAATAQDALAAGFSLMNVRLARQGVDYTQAGDTASPLQHFWSLSVEEQYYLL